MRTKKPTGESRWVDPDEAPPLDRDWFERAEIREGERVIRPARSVGRSAEEGGAPGGEAPPACGGEG